MTSPEERGAFAGFPFGAANSFNSEGAYTSFFPENSWESDPSSRESLIVLDDVLSIQSLVMSYQRRLNRSKKSKPGWHGFAARNAIHTDDTKAYDGSTDEYLICAVSKIPKDPSDRESFRYDEWAMRLRFVQNPLIEAQNGTVSIDEYRFSWQVGNKYLAEAGSVAIQAWFGSSEVYSTSQGTHREWSGIRPIDSYSVEDLAARMNQHMDNVTITDALRMGRRADMIGR